MPRFGLIFILAALLIAGCRQDPGVPYTAPTLEGEWSVSMTLSGGIAGLMRNIEVSSDASYTVTDERAGNTVAGRLEETQLASLEELVSTLEFNAPKTPSACADCFEYRVEIASGGGKMIVEADDVTLGDSGIGSLIQFLREIMDSALK